MIRKLSKAQVWDYFILTARFLLAWTFLSYGFSKLTTGQFGIPPIEMAMPLKDLSLFKVSWYLFDHEPFKSFVGISQVIGGLLLLFNRTTIIGAFFFLPVVTTILLIDLTFMPKHMAQAFTWRLSFYIFLDLLILWHYKDRMKIIWNAVWKNVTTKFKYPIWSYILLPIFAIILEVMGVIPKVLTEIIFHPSETIDKIMGTLESLLQLFKGSK